MDHQLLFRSIPALLLVLTPDLRIAEATDAYLHATMCDRAEILGRDLFEVFPDDPNDAAATGVRNVRASLERVRRERVSDVMAVQKYSLRRPCADGEGFEERYWSPVNAPVLGADGELAWIVHRVEDVTAFVRAAEEMERIAADGSAAPAAAARGGIIGRFAADVYQRAQELQETNRELRATVAALAVARDQARGAEQRVTEILESMTEAFYALDGDLRLTYVNRSAELLWGQRRAEVLGRNVLEVFPGAIGSETHERLERASRLRTPDEFETRSPIIDKWIRVHVYPTAGGLSVYTRDITERRAAEAEAARQAATVRLLRNVAVAANDASEVGPALQAAIDSVCELLDWPVGHAFLVGDGGASVVTSTGLWHFDKRCCDDFRRATEAIQEQQAAGLIAKVIATRRPEWLTDTDVWGGAARTAAAKTSGLHGSVAVPVLVGSTVRAVLEFHCREARRLDPAVLDVLAQVGTQLGRVVEREDAASARRQMLERVVLAEEEERRRLSRDLHDQMAQHLTALTLGVQGLRDDCEDGSSTRAKLAQLEMLAERLGQEARDLAVSLRPPILDDFGLASAIRAQAERWSADTGIPVVLHLAGTEELRLPFATETALYRIVLEALTNVAKHADARHVHVVLETHDSTVVAVVEDDGRGFDAERALRGPGRARGLGLVSMQERAALLGGQLLVDSSPGIGTTVIARIPTARPVAPPTSAPAAERVG